MSPIKKKSYLQPGLHLPCNEFFDTIFLAIFWTSQEATDIWIDFLLTTDFSFISINVLKIMFLLGFFFLIFLLFLTRFLSNAWTDFHFYAFFGHKIMLRLLSNQHKSFSKKLCTNHVIPCILYLVKIKYKICKTLNYQHTKL